MAKRLVFGIDWFGPHTRGEVRESAYDSGLYLAIGRRRGKGNHKRRPQYIGISTSGLCRRAGSPRHPKLKLLNADVAIWLGEIATSEPAGKRVHATRTTLRFAEWLHVYLMALPLNERLKRLPPEPVTVLNRWWTADGNTPRLKRPHPDWPDLVDFAGKTYRARKVWFRAPNQIVHPPSALI